MPMTKIPRLSGASQELKSPETNLWRAVLLTKVRDAMGMVYGVSGDKLKDRASSRRLAAEHAVSFFLHQQKDFEELCLVAGVTPSAARKAILEAIKVRWGDDPVTAIRECSVKSFGKEGLAKMTKENGWDTLVINGLMSTPRRGCRFVQATP